MDTPRVSREAQRPRREEIPTATKTTETEVMNARITAIFVSGKQGGGRGGVFPAQTGWHRDHGEGDREE